MERKTQVQIPKDLLLALFQYHLAGNEDYLPEIEKALMPSNDGQVGGADERTAGSDRRIEDAGSDGMGWENE